MPIKRPHEHICLSYLSPYTRFESLILKIKVGDVDNLDKNGRRTDFGHMNTYAKKLALLGLSVCL